MVADSHADFVLAQRNAQLVEDLRALKDEASKKSAMIWTLIRERDKAMTDAANYERAVAVRERQVEQRESELDTRASSVMVACAVFFGAGVGIGTVLGALYW